MKRPTPVDMEELRARLKGVKLQRVVRLSGLSFSTLRNFRDGDTETLRPPTFAKARAALGRIAKEDAPLLIVGFRKDEVRMRVTSAITKTADGFIHFTAEVELPALQPVK